MKKKYFLFLMLCMPWMWACEENHLEGPLPTIAWEETSGRFHVQTNEALTLVPITNHTDEQSTFSWTMEGKTVGSKHDYTFCSAKSGTFFVGLTVANRFGQTSDEVKITVTERDSITDLPNLPEPDSVFRMHFSQTAYTASLGRTIILSPAWIENGDGIRYEWTIDGTKQDNNVNNKPQLCYTATAEGIHQVELEAWRDTLVQSQLLSIQACPAEGTFRREISAESKAPVNHIYAYRPAPSFMVNGYKLLGRQFPPGCTHEEACDSVCARMQRGWMTCLGAWGGYLIAGFDHSVENRIGEYDLCIKGNPFNYQSEPGIIWVSQDENGDGLPNDTWFELAGSEYGTENWEAHYAITYYKPTQPAAATGWRDCRGKTGIIPYMSYWNPEPYYWQDWMEGDTYTFYGSRLENHHIYENGVSTMPPYDWGYADNSGKDWVDTPIGKAGLFKIEHARDALGKPADLTYIDFVKIQTAQTGYTPNLGDISTEIYFIGDYQLMK